MKGKGEGEETATAAVTGSSRDGGSGRSYEVFLSFRGPDARLTIANCLYNYLIRAGIRVFKDDEELRFGKEIEGGLLQAINDSRIYILIFSKDYASSKWCLRELARIVELSRDNDEKVILPIFYDVDADDVKLKTDLYRKALRKHKRDSGKDLVKKWKELYRKALRKHKRDSGKDSVKKWKKALREVARIKGRNLKDHGLHELINLTVEKVSSLLWTRQTDVPDHLVGIEDRIDEIMKELDLGACDVRFIVIHGMGGIGKTTLAEAVFRQISPQFQGDCCFLRDVRTNDILNLQKKLLFEILDITHTNFSFINDGANMIKKQFEDKKVLIILDDIDKVDQIEGLAGHADWFGGGSRIIITTRNIDFLVSESEDDNGSHYQDFSIYKMPEMDPEDALQLLCERALGLVKPPPDYMDISSELIYALGRLPLALNVIGSTLRGEPRSTWVDYLEKLKKVMDKDVKEKLMISYEALDFRRQQIYLDIACFFINKEKVIAMKYWDALFEYPTRIDVKFLTHMSLIRITDDDRLWMHDQLRDLGRDIVHPKSGKNDQSGSRLWSPEDAIHVVQRKKGNEKVVALNLGTPTPDVMYRFKHEEFVRLVNLTFLQLDHGNFEGDFEDLFFELRWLSWSNCPLEFRATNLGLRNLVVLELSGDNITEGWGGWSQIMVAKQLKVLKLVDCPSLRKTPEFFSISRLERLILMGCPGLEKIDESIGNLQHLEHLMIDCEGIMSDPNSLANQIREPGILSMLPQSIGNLAKLKHLLLSSRKLRKLPHSIGQLESLLELRVQSTGIRKLPYSIGNLGRLEILQITGLEKLPYSIGRLQSLVDLDVSFSSIGILPDCIKNLKKLKVLNLCDSDISELPKSIGMLENLEELYAQCRNLEGEIPSEIGALSSLKILNLFGAPLSGLPTTINQLTNLQELTLYYCRSIQRLPELPKSLTDLSFSTDSLTTFPDLSNLTNLVELSIVGESMREELNIEGIVKLCSLRTLYLRVKKMALPPIDFSSFSQLRDLCINCANPQSLIGLPSSLRVLSLNDAESPIDWSLFSNLENLSTLGFSRYGLGEIRFEVLEKLRKFNDLTMSICPLLKTLLVLPGLKGIQRLSLAFCPQLTEIQGLGELKSLRHLNFEFCDSIKSLNESDLSHLQNLKRLIFRWCQSLESVLGVPKSCELSVSGCPRFKRDG